MRTAPISKPVVALDVGALAAQVAEARQQPAVGPGQPDPWREIAIAAAENARFLALGCFTLSPIRKRADDVRRLICEVYEYDQKNALPLGAKMALGVAAAVMGMELGARATNCG